MRKIGIFYGILRDFGYNLEFSVSKVWALKNPLIEGV